MKPTSQTLTNEPEIQQPSSIFSSPKSFLGWIRLSFDHSLILFQLFYFAFYAAFGSLFPLISIYFKQLGLNAIQCGLLSGLRSLTESMAAPFWVAFANKWKKGKSFVIFSLLCSMAFTLGLGFVRPSPAGCLVSLVQHLSSNTSSDNALQLSIIEPYKGSKYDSVKSVDMDRDLALNIRNKIGQSPLYLNTKLLVEPPKMKATRWGSGIGQPMGDKSLYSLTEAYHDSSQYPPGSLVMPLYSTVVYSQTKINQIFIVILILVSLSEIFSCATIPIVDAAVVQHSELDSPSGYERQRIFGSLGWGLAMFFIGLALDHSTSFPDYPCLTPGYREKNYIVCFAVYSVFIAFALFIATQFSFDYEGSHESMYFKLVKDKMAKMFLGRQTKNRSKLVNENEDGDGQSPNAVGHDSRNSEEDEFNALGKRDNKLSSNVAASAGSKHTNEEILEQQLGIKFERNNANTKPINSQPSIDLQQEEMIATQLKITRWFQALKQFRQPRLLVFLFVIWFMGLGIGQVFTFLFWHMQELNGSPTLFGLASIINHISEIIMYQFSKRLLDMIGHLKVLYLGLLGNVARFLYVSWITNPWWILPFEFIQGLTNTGIWVACCSYITQAFVPEFRSTTLGFLRVIHYGFGRGLGAFFGGLIVSSYGTSAMFRTYGVASAMVLLGFLLLNYIMPIPEAVANDNVANEFNGIQTTNMDWPNNQAQNLNSAPYSTTYQTTEVVHDYYLQQQKEKNNHC